MKATYTWDLSSWMVERHRSDWLIERFNPATTSRSRECTMPIVTGIAFALLIVFIVLFMTHAARDLQSSPIVFRLRRRLND